jgi:hypothetical protein
LEFPPGASSERSLHYTVQLGLLSEMLTLRPDAVHIDQCRALMKYGRGLDLSKRARHARRHIKQRVKELAELRTYMENPPTPLINPELQPGAIVTSTLPNLFDTASIELAQQPTAMEIEKSMETSHSTAAAAMSLSQLGGVAGQTAAVTRTETQTTEAEEAKATAEKAEKTTGEEAKEAVSEKAKETIAEKAKGKGESKKKKVESPKKAESKKKKVETPKKVETVKAQSKSKLLLSGESDVQLIEKPAGPPPGVFSFAVPHGTSLVWMPASWDQLNQRLGELPHSKHTGNRMIEPYDRVTVEEYAVGQFVVFRVTRIPSGVSDRYLPDAFFVWFWPRLVESVIPSTQADYTSLLIKWKRMNRNPPTAYHHFKSPPPGSGYEVEPALTYLHDATTTKYIQHAIIRWNMQQLRETEYSHSDRRTKSISTDAQIQYRLIDVPVFRTAVVHWLSIDAADRRASLDAYLESESAATVKKEKKSRDPSPVAAAAASSHLPPVLLTNRNVLSPQPPRPTISIADTSHADEPPQERATRLAREAEQLNRVNILLKIEGRHSIGMMESEYQVGVEGSPLQSDYPVTSDTTLKSVYDHVDEVLRNPDRLPYTLVYVDPRTTRTVRLMSSATVRANPNEAQGQTIGSNLIDHEGALQIRWESESTS